MSCDDGLPDDAGGARVLGPLAGISNSRVTLMMEPGSERRFVRKQATEPWQSARLKRQCARQRWAHARGLRVPRVLGSGVERGCFYFDMSYVPGRTLAEAGTRVHAIDCAAFERFLTSLLTSCAGPAERAVPPQRFPDKLAAIGRDCRATPALVALQPSIDTLLDDLILRPWQGVPDTSGHGDLTFDNIIVTADGGFVAIDFDEPDPSSLWLDLAKLRQDTHGLWCLRPRGPVETGGARFADAVEALAPLRRVVDTVSRAVAPDSLAMLPQMTIFHLLRILPYCRDEPTAAYVVERAQALAEE